MELTSRQRRQRTVRDGFAAIAEKREAHRLDLKDDGVEDESGFEHARGCSKRRCLVDVITRPERVNCHLDL